MAFGVVATGMQVLCQAVVLDVHERQEAVRRDPDRRVVRPVEGEREADRDVQRDVVAGRARIGAGDRRVVERRRVSSA